MTETLSQKMDFDHPVEVHEDGTVTDGPFVLHVPNLTDGELETCGEWCTSICQRGWEFVTTGYSGQDSYSGPIMHDSELIGGGLERDILATPGVYVALVSEYMNVCSECHEDTTYDDNDHLTHVDADIDEDHDAADDETYVEGWAIVRLKD